MPVNLKLIPAPAFRPRPPVWWKWLLLLVVMLLGGITDAILSNMSRADISTDEFWTSALGLPSLFWLTLLVLRISWYKGQLATAQSKDNARGRQLRREIQRGQRYLNVFGMSLHSALREPDDTDGSKQWDALQEKVKGLKNQPSWKSREGIRHSRLAQINGESPEQMLSRGLKKTLNDLSLILSSLPPETQLDLLLEINSSIPENQIEDIWLNSWSASQIRQSATRIEGDGLTSLDKWLDDARSECSLLLVVGVQLRPDRTEGSAESIVGLLLGGQSILPESASLARLHRPELMHHAGTEDFQYALKQALEWVPISANAVKHGFLVGVKPEWHMAIATGLQAIHSPINVGQDIHDLRNTLGFPGPAAPWVAIACTVRGSQFSGTQIIVSCDDQLNTPLWVTLVTPAGKKQQ